MSEEKPPGVADHDFTPPEGVEVPTLTDSQAAQALAAGDNKTFLKWMTQIQFEASRRPEGTAEYDVQIRIAMAYYNASRTEGPEDQQKHKNEALTWLTGATQGITNELVELDKDYSEASKRPDRQERIQALRKLIGDIRDLRTEIMR